MTKKLDTTTITRDLEGSAFFPKTTTPTEKSTFPPPAEPVKDPTLFREDQGARPVRRKIRHAFDIHEDQIDSLRRLSYEARLRGEEGSMSAMVRSALDEFIGKRETQK
jgi:hypothetical protein